MDIAVGNSTDDMAAISQRLKAAVSSIILHPLRSFPLTSFYHEVLQQITKPMLEICEEEDPQKYTAIFHE